MSNRPIDEAIVRLSLENEDFEKNAAQSLETFAELNEQLGSTSSTDMGSLVSGVENLNDKFSLQATIVRKAYEAIGDYVVGAGKKVASFANNLTFGAAKDGFKEYESIIDMTKVLKNSAKDADGNALSLARINAELDKLNNYADETIYSFKDMVDNVTKFTNQGVALEDATEAIKGISNLAALSGANAAEASRAMLNFSQAIATGSMKLIDWKSIINARMDTLEFKEELLKTALALGTVEKKGDEFFTTTVNGQGKLSGAFTATSKWNDALQHNWITTEVLTETLRRYGDANTEVGQKAYDAARQVTTFSKLMDTIRESIGSRWANFFRTVVGDLDEATKIWTKIAEIADGVLAATFDKGLEALSAWKQFGGRADLLEGIVTAFRSLNKLFEPIIFFLGKVLPKDVASGTIVLLNFTDGFKMAMTAIYNIVDPLSSALKSLLTTLIGPTKVFIAALYALWIIFTRLLDYGSKLVRIVAEVIAIVSDGVRIIFDFAGAVLKALVPKQLIDFVNNLIAGVRKGAKSFGAFLDGIGDKLKAFREGMTSITGKGALGKFLKWLESLKISDKVSVWIDQMAEGFGNLGKAIGSLAKSGFSKVTSAFKTLKTVGSAVKDVFTGNPLFVKKKLQASGASLWLISVVNVATKVKKVLQETSKKIKNFFTNIVPAEASKKFNDLSKVITSRGKDIRTGLSGVWLAIKEFFKLMASGNFKKASKAWSEMMLKALKVLGKSIKNFVKDFVKALTGIDLSKFKNKVKKAFDDVKSYVKNFKMDKFKKDIKEAFTIENLKVRVKSITLGLKNIGKAIWKFGKDTAKKILPKSVYSALQKGLKAIKEFVKKAKDSFLSIRWKKMFEDLKAKDFKSFFKDIGDDIVKPIGEALTTIKNKIVEWGDSLTNGAFSNILNTVEGFFSKFTSLFQKNSKVDLSNADQPMELIPTDTNKNIGKSTNNLTKTLGVTTKLDASDAKGLAGFAQSFSKSIDSILESLGKFFESDTGQGALGGAGALAGIWGIIQFTKAIKSNVSKSGDVLADIKNLLMAPLSGVASSMKVIGQGLKLIGIALLIQSIKSLVETCKLLEDVNVKKAAPALLSISGMIGIVAFIISKATKDLKPRAIFAVALVFYALGSLIKSMAKALKTIDKLENAEIAVDSLVRLIWPLAVSLSVIGLTMKRMQGAAPTILALSVSMLILAKAVKEFSKISGPEFADGMKKIGVTMAALSVAVMAIALAHKQFSSAAGEILAMAVAMLLIAAAIKIMVGIKITSEAAVALGVFAIAIAGLCAALWAINKIQFNKIAAAIIGLCASFVMLASACLIFGVLWPIMIPGALAIAVLLTALGVFGRLAGKYALNFDDVAKGIVKIGVAMMLLAASFIMLKFVDLDRLDKGIQMLGITLLGLAGIVGLVGGFKVDLSSIFGISVALVALGGSMVALAYSMQMLDKVKPETLQTGLMMFVGALSIVVALVTGAAAPLAAGLASIGAGMLWVAAAAAVFGAAVYMIAAAYEKLNKIDNSKIFAIGENLIAGLAAGIMKGLGIIFGPILTVCNAIINWFKSILGIHSPSTKGEELGENFMQGIMEGFKNMLDKFPGLIAGIATGILNYFKQNWPSIVEGIKNFVVNTFTMIKNKIIELAPTVPEKLKTMFTSMKDYIVKNGPTIAKSAAGMLVSMLNGIKDWIINKGVPGAAAAAKNFSKALLDGFIWMAKSIPSAIANFCGMILDSIKNFLGIKSKSGSSEGESVGKSFVDGVLAGLGSFVVSIPGKMAEFGQAILGGLGTIIPKAGGVATKFISGIVGTISGGKDKAGKASTNVANSVETAMKPLSTKGLTEAGKFVSNVAGKIGGGVKTVGSKAKSIATTAASKVSTLANGGVKSAKSFVSGIATNISKGVKKVTSSSKKLGAATTKATENMKQSGTKNATDFVKNVAGKIKKGTTSASSAAKALAKAAKNGIQSIMTSSSAYHLGENFGNGLVRGLNSKISKVRSAARALARAANSSAASAMESHSPSRVAMRLGGYFGEGLAIGIEDKARLAANSAANVAYQVIDAIDNTLSESEAFEPEINPVLNTEQLDQLNNILATMPVNGNLAFNQNGLQNGVNIAGITVNVNITTNGKQTPQDIAKIAREQAQAVISSEVRKIVWR